MSKAQERRFAAVRLRLPIPSDKKIVALTQHINNLVVGLDPLQLLSVPFAVNADGEIELGAVKFHNLKMKENMKVNAVKSLSNHILVHLVIEERKLGPILDLTTSFQLVGPIEKAAETVCVDITPGSMACASSYGDKVKVRTLDGKKWNESFSRDMKEKIVSVALASPHLFVATATSLFVFDMRSDAEATQKIESPTPPFVTAVTGGGFFTSYGRSAMVLSPTLHSNFPAQGFKTDVVDHCTTGKLYASIGGDQLILYDFAKMTGSAEVKGAKHVCAYSQDILVATENDVLLALDATEIIDDVLSGSTESLSSRITQVQLAIFDQFWQKGDKASALGLFRARRFKDALPDVLSIFPSLVLPEMSPSRLLVEPTPQDDEACRLLVENLLEIDDEKNVLLNTAIVELLAKIGEMEKMSDFLGKLGKGKMRDDLVRSFLEKHAKNSLVYYLRAMKQYDQALEMFKAAENVEEVKNTIVANGKDFEFVRANIDWIMERDPVIGVKVFGDAKVSWSEGIKLASERYPEYYMAVLREIVMRKNVVRHTEFLNKYCQEMVAILSDMKKRGFNRDRVCFCECVIKNRDADIDEIREELIKTLVDVVKANGSDIGPETKVLLDTVDSPAVRIELYQATNQPEKALELLWEETRDFEQCEKKLCKDNPSLLIGLLSIAREEIPQEELLPKVTSLIKNNLTKIDTTEALQFISGDLPLEDVADFLEECFCSLNSVRTGSEIRAACSSSQAFETEYERTKLALQCVEVQKHTVCFVCGRPLGFTSIRRTPDGFLCHEKCIESDV